MPTLAQRRDMHAQRLDRHGHAHVLRFWNELSDVQRGELLDDLDQIDLERCTPLLDTYVRRRPTIDVPARLEPAPAFPIEPTPDLKPRYAAARERGIAAIRAGQVAAFTVAGGQGTRLGYPGPKGGFPVTPIRKAPLFQVFAEYLRGVERRWGRRPWWYIMTSPQNHAETLQIFQQAGWFGLTPDDVMFFPQGQMPAFLPDGRIALAEKHRLALSPDGHGGSLTALRASGALEDMRRRGVEYISYFQVDNPLVRAIDPLFVGLHAETGSEMSSKAVAKADDLERVGNFCLGDGKLMVIEYSDMPEALAKARNADGSRRFDAGSIAIHVLSRSFVERLTAPGTGAECGVGLQPAPDAGSHHGRVSLPWHRADKKVAVVDDAGRVVTPGAGGAANAPNVVKLEMFVFDAIPLARSPLLLMTDRSEEFSPVKNAEGADSPATSRADQIRRAARWLASAGIRERPDELEISPAFALDAEDLAQRIAAGAKPSASGLWGDGSK